MESRTLGVSGTGMDERDVAPEGAPVRVPAPRSWEQGTESTYRSLFGAVSDTPVADDDAVAVRPRRSRRRTRTLLVAALVLLLLAGGAVAGGLAWAAQARKKPALDALRAGNTAFEGAAAPLRRATDLDSLRTAAQGAGAAADRIDRAARPVSDGSTALARGVRDVLRDEASLLRAADKLTSLKIETLGTWPAVRDTMGDAESALDADVATLARLEPEAARQVRTGRALAAHSDQLVGDFAGTSIVGLLDTSLEALVAAQSTADLRAAAAGTAQSTQVVTLALQGVAADGPQGTRITRVGGALAALAALRTLNGDTLASWPALRAKLAAATTGIDGVDSRNALVAVDVLVSRATQQLAAWKAATAKATAKAQKDATALSTYVTAIGAAMASQAQADQADATFLARVKSDPAMTSQDAIAYLDAAAKARTAVSDALVAPTPPQALLDQHQALVDAAGQASQVLSSARAGTGKQKCGTVPPTVPGGKPTPAPCLYSATPGAAAFATGSAARLQAWTAVKKDWDDAVTAAQQAIAERKLPVKPVV
jgi:hypothetical protein